MRISRYATTTRFVVIGLMVLVMYIPLAMVDGITRERQSYFDRTVTDVASAWGGEQVLSGPFLVIPEVATGENIGLVNGAPVVIRDASERVFVPALQKLTISITHQMRQRALYEVPVYTALLRVEGEFAALEPELLNRRDRKLNVDRARLVLGIPFPRAISSASKLTFGSETTPFQSGSGLQWVGQGIHAVLAGYDGSRAQAFSLQLELRGTRSLSFTPVGNDSRIEMTSTWPHPSFNGQYLPEHHEITADGFSAAWVVHELARNLPATWRVDQNPVALDGLTARVDLFQPVTGYRLVDRAIKYGVLFISLTFLSFVCFELTLGLKFHLVQYGVVGVGLVLFYLALLSLSEHLAFSVAYAVSTALLTGLVGWYVRGMSGSLRLSFWAGVLLATLYAVLYVLLQLEAYALLVGTAVLFLGLGALMFSTRTLTASGEQSLAAMWGRRAQR